MNDKEIIKEKLNIFKNLYSEVQVFGPIEKDGFWEEKASCMLNETCVKNNSCINCIAIRSLMENKSIRKYCEYNGKSIYMIATPIEYNDKK